MRKTIIKNFIFYIGVLVIGFLFLFYFKEWDIWVWAAPTATNKLGSNFDLCTVSGTVNYGGAHPSPKFEWTFTSSQSDYSDGTPPPTESEGTRGPSSQVSVWIEVDDNSDFSSPAVDTGEIATTSQSYLYNGNNLSYGIVYFWRIKAKDSYDTISDWAKGDILYFPEPAGTSNNSIKLHGGVKLHPSTILK